MTKTGIHVSHYGRRWETGRRFDLARLLADRLCMNDLDDEPLHPATQSYTYRQKVQRAFAIELLAPIAAVDDFLDGDTSEEKQKDAAGHFNVSEQAMYSPCSSTIGRISREEALDTRDPTCKRLFARHAEKERH